VGVYTQELDPKQEGAIAVLQSRVLRFGLLQDGDVGVGVFPEGEEDNLRLLPVCRPLVENRLCR
jgi:hypothetical protein